VAAVRLRAAASLFGRIAGKYENWPAVRLRSAGQFSGNSAKYRELSFFTGMGVSLTAVGAVRKRSADTSGQAGAQPLNAQVLHARREQAKGPGLR
jgi:hypothetical protein